MDVVRLDHRLLELIIGDETVSFDLLIKSALVFTGDGPVLRVDVGVTDGRISALEPSLPTHPITLAISGVLYLVGAYLGPPPEGRPW
jgi:hypothetical protein